MIAPDTQLWIFLSFMSVPVHALKSATLMQKSNGQPHTEVLQENTALVIIHLKAR